MPQKADGSTNSSEAKPSDGGAPGHLVLEVHQPGGEDRGGAWAAHPLGHPPEPTWEPTWKLTRGAGCAFQTRSGHVGQMPLLGLDSFDFDRFHGYFSALLYNTQRYS